MIKDKNGNFRESPISYYFGLSYASWLTLPRLVMESMPYEWQKQMKKLLDEVDKTFDWLPKEGDRYWVSLRDKKGKYKRLSEELCDYRRGNIEHLKK